MAQNYIESSPEVHSRPTQLPPEHQFIDRRGISAVRPPDLTHPSPFLSLSFKRSVNTGAPEFTHISTFQDELAELNDGYYVDEEDGERKRRVKPDDYHSSLPEARNLHVTILQATDIGQVILRNMCNDNGDVIKPQKVADRLQRASRNITNSAAKDNSNLKKQRRRLLDANPGGWWVDDEGRQHGVDPSGMIGGIFRVSKDMETYGRGNVFGLQFESEAANYIAIERDKALDITLNVLGINSLDRDLEDIIRSRKPHVSLIRMGLRIPRSERRLILPAAIGDRIVPETFVTELDPKARAVITNAKK